MPRPRGRLLLLEHVRSPVRVVSVIQSLLKPLSVRFAGDNLERSKWGIVERVAARKPAFAS